MKSEAMFLSMMFMVSMLVVQMNAPIELTEAWEVGTEYYIVFWWTPELMGACIEAHDDTLGRCSIGLRERGE